jgi:hypothetical protein
MQVEYGPPGHKGVTQIMGLGALDYGRGASLIPTDKPSRTVGLLALATFAGGVVLGVPTAKHLAIGGLLALVYVQLLKKPAPETVAPPVAVQGWG